VVLWVTPPLVPVILNEKVPVDVDVLVVTVIVDVPWAVTELGLNLALEPEGSPRTVNVTEAVDRRHWHRVGSAIASRADRRRR
jgi:hypothetical protein